MTLAKLLLNKIRSIQESRRINESIKWNNFDIGMFDPEEEDIKSAAGKEINSLSKKYLGTPAIKTFLADSESDSKVETIIKTTKGIQVGKPGDNLGYFTYLYTIDGNKVLGSNWDGIFWIMSASKFDF